MKLPKQNFILRNVIIFVLYILSWMVIDLVDVKDQRLPDHELTLPIVLTLILVSFMWANIGLVDEKPKKYIIVPLLSLVLTGIWFSIASFVVINFHLYIGGSL